MKILAILLISTGLAAFRLDGIGQGIKGQVFWLSGNQMPGSGHEKRPGLGVKRDIFIYKVATRQDVTKEGDFFTDIRKDLVAQTTSSDDGDFKVKLPPGEYSVFVKEPKGYFANIMDGQGRINVVLVKPGQYTWTTITIDYDAFY